MTAATKEDVRLHRSWHRHQSGDIGKAIAAFLVERSNIVVPFGAQTPIPTSEPIAFWTEMAGGETDPVPYTVIFATTPMDYQPGHAILADEQSSNGWRRYYVAEYNHGYAKLLKNEVIVENARHTPSPLEIITMIKDSRELIL